MEIFITLAILSIWVFGLSLITFFQFRFLKNLVRDSGEKDLIKILKKILNSEDLNSKSIEHLENELAKEREISLSHVQKVGLIRFNPFHETGGDHSFSLAMLDGRDFGFIITGLHPIERTTIY